VAIKGGIPKTPAKPAESANRSADRADFIDGAPGKTTYPWLAPRVRDDVMHQVNMKQPERLMLQVRWLAEQEGIPLRQLIENMIRDGVATRFRKRGIQE
jgi:hypothetical protein